jgi:hypothetical protein
MLPQQVIKGRRERSWWGKKILIGCETSFPTPEKVWAACGVASDKDQRSWRMDVPRRTGIDR